MSLKSSRRLLFDLPVVVLRTKPRRGCTARAASRAQLLRAVPWMANLPSPDPVGCYHTIWIRLHVFTEVLCHQCSFHILQEQDAAACCVVLNDGKIHINSRHCPRQHSHLWLLSCVGLQLDLEYQTFVGALPWLQGPTAASERAWLWASGRHKPPFS